MDEQAWLQRIDRHLAASEDHMRRGNEMMARNERAFLDLQNYLREATAMLGRMAAAIHENTVALVENQRVLSEEMRTRDEEMRTRDEEMRTRDEEVREEMRAGRAALFAILDRLQGGAGPSPA